MDDEHSGTSTLLSAFVRVMGLIMLIIGLYIGIKVIFEAWDLYEEPQRIERFADAIERGSNLDSLLASLTPKLANKPVVAPVEGEQQTESVPITAETQPEPLRVTYFLAWFIAILLLMVIGGLASRAIKTGGELALYDLQVKRFAKLLMKEVRNEDND
ncbi:MAG: hypothetical protein ACKE9I_04500 [Methylophagaceae bacterium]